MAEMPKRVGLPFLLLSSVLVLNFACAGMAQDRRSRPYADTVVNRYFTLCFSPGGITSLKRTGDSFDTDYIMKGKRLGDVEIRYRIGNKEWQEVITSAMEGKQVAEAHLGVPPGQSIFYTVADSNRLLLNLSEGFSVENEKLVWTLRCRNLSDLPLEIGDIALPLPMNNHFAEDPFEIFERRVIKHHFISGDGSFIYWMRPNGAGPYLVMTVEKGTRLEYFDLRNQGERLPQLFSAYIHSGVRGKGEARGTWRQRHTTVLLKPNGTRGDEVVYGFTFRWAQDYDGVRNILYSQDQIDVRAIPGMTVPEDLFALLSLRTKAKIRSVLPEYPRETSVQYMGSKQRDVSLYRVTFRRLGENILTVNYGTGQSMVLEFFVAQPLEVLIKKRAAFIVNKQQHRDSTKWYDGLFSQWDMRNKVLRGPENTDGFDGWWGYVLACDDPGLCKAPFIAAKNVYYPDRKEIESVEYYLKNFVWGKLQYTEKDTPYPYGVFGVPNWFENRNKKEGLKEKGEGLHHVWRTYDYPHMIMLYYHMYQIAKLYPEMTSYLGKMNYLDRAFGTAMALFTVPDMIYPVHEAIRWASYNELVIVDLISALQEEGRSEDGKRLRNEWEKKVKYFLYDDPYPFRSEYSFDATAYESTQEFARYAIDHPMSSDSNLWYDNVKKNWHSHPSVMPEDALRFMEKQMSANLACRGVIEPAYYYLGSDYRGESGRYSLSYMSQMGGWAILDYALHYARNPTDYLRLGYASYLSSWALMNAGTPESRYGFWYPGIENDGASGWAFESQKYTPIWIRKETGRGAWFYDGEIDLGYGGALRAAATIVADDPLFGLFAYGGLLKKTSHGIEVIPKDGLRSRFHVVRQGQKLRIFLERDGFAENRGIAVDDSLREIRFALENRSANEHKTEVRVSGLPGGSYRVVVDRGAVLTSKVDSRREIRAALPIGRLKEHDIVISRIKE